MAYTIEALKDKIREFHPEIEPKGLTLTISFEEVDNKYLVNFGKAGQEFGFYLEKKDADDCMAGKTCVNLAVMVAECLVELEDRSV